MKRLFEVLFASKEPAIKSDETSQPIADATAKHAREADSLLETIRDFLEKNDRVTGRPVHVRKSRS